MRVPIEALNSEDPFDLPCIRFEGSVSTRMGYMPSSQMREAFALAAMPFAQALHSVAGDTMANIRFRDDARGRGCITLPEFVFNAYPTPQAFTLVQDDAGVIYINQG